MTKVSRGRLAEGARIRTIARPLIAISFVACGGAAKPASSVKPSTDLEMRVARIEAYIAKNADAIEFLGLVFDQQKAQKAAQEEEEVAPDAVFAVPIEDSVKAGLVEGPATAAVTIVKAFDFTCPHCMRSSDVMTELVKEYGGKVRVVFKNLVVHSNARSAHLASCAAAKQGKYLAYKKAFWERGFGPYLQSGGDDETSLQAPNLVAIAKSTGLDTRRFEADMTSPTCAESLERDQAELGKFRVTGTPTFFVNGTMIPGALPKEAFKSIIDDKLKAVAASGVPAAQYYEREVLAKGETKYRSAKTPKPSK